MPISDNRRPYTILFDLDGTLIDSTEAILESFARSFEILGGEVPDVEVIKAQVGHPLADMYRKLGVPEERIDDYVRTYKENYRQVHTQKTVLLPGAEAAVKKAAEFARLGIVTTKTGLYSQELMEHFGLMEYFDVLIGSEDVTRHKPHPEPILSALKRMGCPPKGCWMIGDTCMDLEAARRAGIEGIGLLCGYGKEEDLRRCGERLAPDALSAVTLIAQTPVEPS
ncbi:HAD family hydrolase [Nitratifractor salsuginis]|uniref:phosphoglycolate phosphatase n=1 Tax=Nitratifractor salsuginis (strain DSM 16511 / JCM 12458 / E9I37-1) TaxID=749222 RepID=E6X1D5_NITSE|nr:HAD family hydrolase [Nitratifractor salsuginis]ADV46997.1 HAD-superfamily hydrolase, subfamily IA, variant 3 [Nitratifractor salsuginis DSM 16511]